MSMQGWAATDATCTAIKKDVLKLKSDLLKDLEQTKVILLVDKIFEEILFIIEKNREE